MTEKHYNSVNELQKDIENGVYDTPNITITPQDWLVMCSKINGCRKTKTLKPFEFEQCRSDVLSFCIGKQNDIIIFTDVQHIEYKCRVSQIQQDWDARITVMQRTNKTIIPLYKLVIDKIHNSNIKRKQQKEVELDDLSII